MDSHPHNGTAYGNDPHAVIESEEPHGKLSVMKKMKAKAKKLKNSFTKHAHGGHGHDDIADHGSDHDRDYAEIDDDDDDDDDDDEEMVQSPEIHGAPMYESGAIKSAVREHDTNKGGSPGVTFEEKDVMEPESPANTPVGRVGDYPSHLDHRPEGDHSPIIGDSGKLPVLQEESKVSDPTGPGAKEAGISQLHESFEKMRVHDEPKSNPHQDPHDQFSFEQSPDTKTPTHDQFISELSPPDQFSSEPYPTKTPAHDEFSIEVTPPEKRPAHDEFSSERSPPTKTDADEPVNQSSNNSYTDRLSYATSGLAGTAISAKNAVASKLGYGPKDDTPVTQFPRESETTKTPQSPSSGGYVSKITSTVTDKLGYGPKDDTSLTQSPRESEPTKTPESKAAGGGGYMSTITEKLGYGPKVETSGPKSPGHESKDKETTGGYGSTIASTVTGTLAPMYGKVAGAGSTVLSKVTGSGPGTTDTCAREGEGPEVKQSWMEILKPGEEDKALSDTISEALYKRKDETSEHKEESKPMGKVTESEHVARRLGTGDEERENVDNSGEVKVDAADPTGANKGMVNMVKGAVSSWFGKGEPGEGTEEKAVHVSSK